MPAAMTNVDPSVKRTARLAGLLYLMVVIAGPFMLLYIPGKLFVRGDAAATAASMLAQQGLVEAHVALGVITELLFIGTVLALYELLKGVDRRCAALMAIVVLVDAPLAFLDVANEAATLGFLRDPGFMRVLEPAQREAMTMLLMNFNNAGIIVQEFFWGLWLLPLAFLVYRCGFIPRLIGAWLGANGLTYIVLSAMRLTAPELASRSFTLVTPLLLGEVALMLWLLIAGARSRQPAPAAPAFAQ